jgi:hypothetical protein
MRMNLTIRSSRLRELLFAEEHEESNTYAELKQQACPKPRLRESCGPIDSEIRECGTWSDGVEPVRPSNHSSYGSDSLSAHQSECAMEPTGHKVSNVIVVPDGVYLHHGL